MSDRVFLSELELEAVETLLDEIRTLTGPRVDERTLREKWCYEKASDALLRLRNVREAAL